MGWMARFSRLLRRQHRALAISRVMTRDVPRRCRFEQMEPRRLLDADPIQIGVVYLEEDIGSDLHGDTFEVTFRGGAPNTQLVSLIIDGDRAAAGFGAGDVMFDTVQGERGADRAFPFTLLSHTSQNPQARVTQDVIDGGTRLLLTLDGFTAGDRLRFEIDVDEVEAYDPNETDPDVIYDGIDPLTSGVEFQGSRLQATFTAPNYFEASGTSSFVNRYDSQLNASGLDLPADDFQGKRDRSAAAFIQLVQDPLPVRIAGKVYADQNLNLRHDGSEQPLSGVQLELFRQVNGSYVSTGHTTQTDTNGNYEFGTALNLKPGTYQVRETQPSDWFSVGAVPGRLTGLMTGSTGTPVGATDPTNRDVLTEIQIPWGGHSAIELDFAEALPASISGYVYHDQSNDGRRDANETGLPNVMVQLVPVTTIVPQMPLSVTTDASGFYRFEGLAPGTYHLVEPTQPDGYFDGLDTSGTVGGQIRGTADSTADRLNGIQLQGGDAGIEFNFGELVPASLSGRVHLGSPSGNCFDPNYNHPPLAGVRLQLLDTQGQVLAETTTDAQGRYRFENLRPGLYSIRQFTPAGLIDGGERIGTIGGQPMGTVSDDLLTRIALASAQQGVDYDFCEYQPASLSGHVYHDFNDDGQRASDEEPLADVTLTLFDDHGNVVASTTTDAQGAYQFTGLRAGHYRVVQTQPADWIDGREAIGQVAGTVVGQQTANDQLEQIRLAWGDQGQNYDFGELRPVALSGYVFHDRLNNGRRDAGDEGIAGVTVQIIPVSSSAPQTTITVTTDAQGFYQTTRLSPGVYRIVEQQPNGYQDGTDIVGTVGGTARGTAVNPGDQFRDVRLTSGEVGQQYNFGEYRFASLAGRVKLTDPQGNCETGSNITPVAGVTIQLLDAAGDLLQSTTTDASGAYRFTELLPGTYSIRELTPTGLIDAGDHLGTVDGQTVGELLANDWLGRISLSSGQAGIDYDFCEHTPAELSGFVYHDANDDGLFQPTESPLENVRIELFDSGGERVAQTQTAADGSYRFAGLRADTYTVIEQQPSGYVDGKDTVGQVGGAAIGRVPASDRLDQIALQWGDQGRNYNFGELLPVIISGYVFHDRLNNGQRDAADEGIAGVTLTAIPLASSAPQTALTAVTNNLGFYQFVGLSPGSYRIVEQQPSDYEDGHDLPGTVGGQTRGTASNPGDVITDIRLASGEEGVQYNFGEYKTVSIRGMVRLSDEDGNCDSTASLQRPLANVTIRLLDANGVEVSTTQTGSDGRYAFNGLLPGSYSVVEVTPNGLIDGDEHVGKVDGRTVGQATSTDTISQITLSSGQVSQDNDFCEHEPASIAGFVYHDLDNDGRREPGEPPISGVKVELFDANGQRVGTVLTADDGSYRFEMLRAGTYTTVQTQPDGWIDGLDTPGTVNGQSVGTRGEDRLSGIVVKWGQQGKEYNFGEFKTATIQGMVRLSDPEGNCDSDASYNRPLANVVVRLLNERGEEVTRTTTGADGRYRFADLLPGTYTVVEETPLGLIDGGEHLGQVNGTTVGEILASDVIGKITLTSGQVSQDNDFCEYEPAAISGFVYHDLDNDGLREPSEPPIPGVTVTLFDATGRQVAMTTTGSDGSYSFDMLRAGNYTVAQTQPSNWVDGQDTLGTVSGSPIGMAGNDRLSQVVLKWGQTGVDYNFGELQWSRIAGFVFSDPNQNCTREATEVALAGVVIELLDGSGRVIATQQTAADGSYQFEQLLPGRYAVRQLQPTSHFQVGQTAGTGGGDASVENLIDAIDVISGQNLTDYAFCELPPSSISGYVFQDGPEIETEDGLPPEDISSIRDGVLTADDVPIAGVVLELRHGLTGEPMDASEALPGLYAAGPIRVTTDANGFYQFQGLRGGRSYAVFQLQPEGYFDSIDTPGSTSGIAFNANSPVSPLIFMTLTTAPKNDAIVRIPLAVAQDSTDNNFSEVTVKKVVNYPLPPLPPTPPPPSVPVSPAVLYVAPTPLPIVMPMIAPEPWVLRPGGTGGVLGYTWHLSVIDAGTPRDSESDTAFVNAVWRTGIHLQQVSWTSDRFSDVQWVLASRREAAEGEAERELITARGQRLLLFGLVGALPVAGDFNGDGLDEFGIYHEGEWFIDLNGNGRWDADDLWVKLGTKQDFPVTGDWDGDGKDDIGIYGPEWAGDERALTYESGLPDASNRFSKRPQNPPPPIHEATDGHRLMKLNADGPRRADLIDHVFRFGEGQITPVAGDWNGDGIRGIGIFQDGKWLLDTNGDGRWTKEDQQVTFGEPGDRPVVGDFNGDGVDDLGVFRGGKWFLDSNGNRELDAHDRVFEMGQEGDLPIAGDWDGDGIDDPAVYRASEATPPPDAS